MNETYLRCKGPCKRTQQLPTLSAQQCWELLRVVRMCCGFCLNGRNNSRHCWLSVALRWRCAAFCIRNLNRNKRNAPARIQHCWAFCAHGPNNVGLRFGDHRTKEMLGLVAPNVWRVSNISQQHPTSANNSQQVPTCCANGRNMLGPTMLGLVGQQCCVRLHGP